KPYLRMRILFTPLDGTRPRTPEPGAESRWWKESENIRKTKPCIKSLKIAGGAMEGILSLKPMFITLPDVFASLMVALVGDYMSPFGEVRGKPDDDLLGSILAKLKEIRLQDSEAKQHG
ncbi:MAG: hypothetical protein ACUVRM_10735, partial [Bacillota bacterium]